MNQSMQSTTLAREPAKRVGAKPAFLAMQLMAGALAGKVLGFAREIEMARLLGASFVADGFRAATTATLLPIAMMQGEIVPSILIPLHRQWAAEGSAALRFTLLTILFAAISLPITLAVWILADSWVAFLVGGFGPQAHLLTVKMVRVMALAMPASVVASCLNCVEISIGRSRVSVLRSSVQNIAVMAGIGLMVLSGNPLFIAAAFSLAMNATALFAAVMLIREGELTLSGGGFSATLQVGLIVFRQLRLLILQPIADQANILLERVLSSSIGVGSIASIEYARTLTETANFLISQPIGYVVLAQDVTDRETTRRRVEHLLRPLLALGLPASAFLFLFAPDVVAVILQRGAFQGHATEMTSQALRGIAAGLWAPTAGWILIRMLNAAGKNRIAVLILLSAALAQMATNLATVAHAGVMGIGLGETARGIVILIGAAIALHSGMLALRLLAYMVPPVLAFVAFGVVIRHNVDITLLRLLSGGLWFVLIALLSLRWLAPEVTHLICTRLRFPTFRTRPKALL